MMLASLGSFLKVWWRLSMALETLSSEEDLAAAVYCQWLC